MILDKIAGEVKRMYLPVFLISIFLMLLPLFFSFRVSVEVIAKDAGITYTVKASIFKYVKVLEVKSGEEKKEKKRWIAGREETTLIRDKLFGIMKSAMEKQRGKIFHIEKLSLDGTFSTEDAAANAILYGILMILWQFLLIFLAANFSLEHQNFNFLPDFRNDRNEMMLHVIFRAVLLKVILLVVGVLIETRGKNLNKSE